MLNLQLKGTVSRDFLLLVFLWISFPPAPEHPIRTVSNFFENSRRYSQVQMHHRYQRHWWQICQRSQRHRRQTCHRYQLHQRQFATGISNTGGKFATSFASVFYTGCNLPPVSTTPAANLPSVSLTQVAKNGNNIRLLRPWRQKCIYKLTLLTKGQTK
jgi:hypothetical protein